MEFGNLVKVLPTHPSENFKMTEKECFKKHKVSSTDMDVATTAVTGTERSNYVNVPKADSVADLIPPELPPKIPPKQQGIENELYCKTLPPVLRQKPPPVQPKPSTLDKKRQQVSFINKPPDGLETNCGLCSNILTEPYQTSCCGKYMCSNCKEEKEASKQPCPYCNNKIMRTFLDLNRQHMMQSLMVYCNYKKEGCKWSGRLEELSTHLNEAKSKSVTVIEEGIAMKHEYSEHWYKKYNGCPHAFVQCKNDSCKETVRRSEIKDHEDHTCPMRSFFCEYCNQSQTKPTFHYSLCGRYPVQCPNNCQLTIPRDKLKSHMSTECPLQPFECEFSWAGCEEKLLKCQFVEHNINYQLEHLSLLSKACMTMRKDKKEAEKETQNIKEEVEVCRREIDTMTEEIGQLKSTNDLLGTKIMLTKRSCDGLEKKLYQAVHGALPVLQPDCPITLRAGAKKFYFFSEEYGYKIAGRLSSSASSGGAKATLAKPFNQLSQRVVKTSGDNLEFVIYSEGGIHKVSPEVTQITIITSQGIRMMLTHGYELHSKAVHSSIESQRLTAYIADPGDNVKIINVQ
uniref:RING-type domain-containing protein n=1 Tax=Amphimedon queenslandica TaxID=400682 RepID=A0A1X7VAS0_AMPQE